MNTFNSRQLRSAVLLALIFIAQAVCAISPAPGHTGTAAVAMPDRFAAQATRMILENGGNAVDAAVTAAFVLAVTLPEAGNIGGGGFMVSYIDGQSAFLDFRERAPLGAHKDMFLDEGGNFVQRRSIVGGPAVGVPGTVRGMLAAHERYGSLPWASLLQPAIDLARDGFVVPPELEEEAADQVIDFAGETNFDDYFAKIRAGEVFKQAELATTLERIAKNPEDFYTGHTARLIVQQMSRSGGLITMDDLDSYKAIWREPIQTQWREYTVVTAPPPSSGGIALLQLLKMRDYSSALFADVWHNSPQYIHLLAEIEKRVYADRGEYLGDPDFMELPVAELLNEEYLKRRSAEINPKKISLTPQVKGGLESTDTTHFSILDKAGNAVSLTTTLNWDFGSGVVVEGAGFVLNNEMDDFSAKVGVKNKFGVVGNALNAIEPGKRMLSSMTPTIVLKDDKPALVIGTQGGSTIITSVYQVMLNLYAYGMPLQDAVNATRYHHQLPDALVIRHDPREIPAATTKALTDMGYKVEPNSWGNLGNMQVIKIEDTEIQAVSDNRGRGKSFLIK